MARDTGIGGEWGWDCVSSCAADRTLYRNNANNRRCRPVVCDDDEYPRRIGGTWRCRSLPNNTVTNPGVPNYTCPGGTDPYFGFGVMFCRPNGPGGFMSPARGAPLTPAASTPMSPTAPSVSTPSGFHATANPATANPAPTGTAPPTTVPPALVPIEREVLIDVAEAKCSTAPRMEKVPADLGREWTPPPTECVLDDLPDLPTTDANGWDNVGYRVKVTARNAVGSSAAGTFEPPFMSIPGVPSTLSPVPAERVWFPHYDTSIISIDASGGGTTVIDIPGFVSVPMGRITISNPGGDDISFAGGVTAGRIVVDDSRASLPLGYVPSVVMQREVLITAVAGNITSKATVKVNSDTSYGILRWITQ